MSVDLSADYAVAARVACGSGDHVAGLYTGMDLRRY
jgi:hypothetical protein